LDLIRIGRGDAEGTEQEGRMGRKRRLNRAPFLFGEGNWKWREIITEERNSGDGT
jgi:hypothetical protein